MITKEVLSFEIIDRDSREYNEAILSYNRSINSRPEKIFFCATEKEIQEAILWCRENKREFRVRNGRHHYEGYSTGENLIIIDISKMDKITFNCEDETVSLEGGVKNREAYNAINGLGYIFPGGGCPTVGIAGLTLGGGWGYYSRLVGLTADNLLEASIIDYNGDKLFANENSNRDLFWALRGGGGGNFGIVTNMKFALNKKLDKGTLINIEYENLTLDENVKLVSVWQKLFRNLDRRMNMKMANFNSAKKGIGVKITGVFCGELKECEEILNPLKVFSCKMELSYIELSKCNKIIQDNHPDYESYKSGGRFLNRELTLEEIRELLLLFKTTALGSTYSAVSFYGLGGKIEEVESDATAFFYRKSKFIVGVQSVWENDLYKSQNKLWVEYIFEKLKNISYGSFINFPITQEDYEREYYGDNIDKLKDIKAKYDPFNIFKFPQSIK